MSDRPEVIVVGLGGMGSAAAWRLAQRGARVLGLEQFAPGHTLGSSHGQTRIIRQAYYEHPAYVPLVRRAYEGWYDLEQRVGLRLLTECPCLTLGPPAGDLVAGVRRSAAEHGLPIENLSPAEVRRRFPAFRLDDAGLAAVVEHAAGALSVEECVRQLAHEAAQRGATLRYHEPVLGWQREGGGVVVQTTKARYAADRLVLTAGPWAGRLLGEHGAALRVMRQVALWFEVADESLFRRDRFPIFIADTPGGAFYGLPVFAPGGVKVARHYGAPELPGPEEVDRRVTDADEAPVRAFLRAHLPDADGPRARESVCLYTLTPDRHFLLDRLPGGPEVVLAAGFSGHGFKFAPVVGEVLADLAMRGQTDWPIDLFRLARFTPPS